MNKQPSIEQIVIFFNEQVSGRKKIYFCHNGTKPQIKADIETDLKNGAANRNVMRKKTGRETTQNELFE